MRFQVTMVDNNYLWLSSEVFKLKKSRFLQQEKIMFADNIWEERGTWLKLHTFPSKKIQPTWGQSK